MKLFVDLMSIYIAHTAVFMDIPECLYEISILCDWMNKKKCKNQT